MMIDSFTILGLAANFRKALDGAEYQTVGMIVVFGCLGLLAVILSISAAIASRCNAKPTAPAQPSAPAKAAAPAAAPAGSSNLSPELVAVISAAVNTALDGMQHRILEIKQSPHSGYSASGRSEIFASHRITPRSR